MKRTTVPVTSPRIEALEAMALLFARPDMSAAASTPINSQMMESMELVACENTEPRSNPVPAAAALPAKFVQKSLVNTPRLKLVTVTTKKRSSGTTFNTVRAALTTIAFSTPRLMSRKIPHMTTDAMAIEGQLVPVSPSTGKNVPSAIIIMVAKAMLPIHPDSQYPQPLMNSPNGPASRRA